MRARIVLAGVLLGGALAFPPAVPPAAGAAYYSKEEALALAFPDADDVLSKTVFLTDAHAATIAEQTGAKPESLLFTYYVGMRGGAVLGYAVIDTHVVRTLPETLLAVLTPAGVLERVLILAFYEPTEYQPSEHWLAQFQGRSLAGGGWRLGRDIHGISGATLTARAIPQALQRALLLYDLVMAPKPEAAPD